MFGRVGVSNLQCHLNNRHNGSCTADRLGDRPGQLSSTDLTLVFVTSWPPGNLMRRSLKEENGRASSRIIRPIVWPYNDGGVSIVPQIGLSGSSTENSACGMPS